MFLQKHSKRGKHVIGFYLKPVFGIHKITKLSTQKNLSHKYLQYSCLTFTLYLTFLLIKDVKISLFIENAVQMTDQLL